MIELFNHLLPQFSAIGSGTIPSISAIIVSFMLAILAICMIFIAIHWFNYRRRVTGVLSLIDSQTKESLAHSRRATVEKAFALKPSDIGYIWREFDESLVVSPNQEFLYNTLDAEHFFNPRTLAPGLTGSRLLAATPSFLVAIGVLGTFIGLTVGLNQLNVESSNLDVLKTGIDQMINSAAVAFMTSVWGVALSLFLNLVEKLIESRTLRSVTNLQHRIDFLYPRVSAEQSLVHITENSKTSKDALLELHEKIGSELQKTVTGITSDMQEALTDTLNQIMKPAIQALVDNTSQQSSAALESLITKFMNGINEAGNQQGQQLSDAANNVNQAVSKIGDEVRQLSSQFAEQQKSLNESALSREEKLIEQHSRLQDSAEQQQTKLQAQFEELMSQLSGSLQSQFSAVSELDAERQRRFDDQIGALVNQQSQLSTEFSSLIEAIAKQANDTAQNQRELLGELKQTTQAFSKGASHLDSSSNQLGILSSNLKQSSDVLGNNLSALTEQMTQVNEQSEALAKYISARIESLKDIQDTTIKCVDKLSETAELTNKGFSELSQSQGQFLSGVKAQFEALGDALKAQVEQIEKQASEWLAKYADEVNQQVNHRMDEWNSQTLKFANQMLQTVQAIGDVVDELEEKR